MHSCFDSPLVKPSAAVRSDESLPVPIFAMPGAFSIQICHTQHTHPLTHKYAHSLAHMQNEQGHQMLPSTGHRPSRCTARSGIGRLLHSLVCASLLSCICESTSSLDDKTDTGAHAGVHDTGAHAGMLSLMRGNARAAELGGRWRTKGGITITAMPGGDAVMVTCTAAVGCSPLGSDGNVTVHSADGHGVHGLFMDNITLATSADFLFQVRVFNSLLATLLRGRYVPCASHVT